MRVGIVIRTKDRPLFLVRALKTVVDQSFTDWQIALVNDGGDAATLSKAIAKAGFAALFDDGRALRLDQATSAGRSEAFNIGARALDTEFVCCLDDDDTWDADFLATLVAFFDQTLALAPDLGGVASLVTAIREDLVTEKGREKIVTLGEDTLPQSFRRTDFFLNPIAYATYRHDLYPVQWMLRRDHALAVGGFSSDFNVMEDRAFVTRFLQRWRLAILDKPLAFHHRRVARKGDTKRSVAMNTLDNPSYDWRLFSDLAKIIVNSPPGAASEQPISAAQAGDLIRAAAVTVVKELNDETSALWHKINGEAMALRAEIDALVAKMSTVAPPPVIESDPASRVWSLWDVIGDQDIGYPLAAGKPFLDRLVLSLPEDQAGLLAHGVPAQHRLVVQVPQTRDFAALELDLTGLIDPHRQLSVEVIVNTTSGFAFETALSLWGKDRLGRKTHRFQDIHVHSCPAGGWARIARGFDGEWLTKHPGARFSVILPRHAQNFQLVVKDIVVSRS